MYAGKHGRRRRHDGSNRRPLQAQGLRLPLLGDLRRRRIDLRLRPLRRPAEEQRQGPVVEGDAPGSRRHRRPGQRDHPAPAGLGGQRPPRRLHRPARRLPRLQAPLPRGPSRRAAVPAQAVQAPRRGRAVRPDRGARVQPDVQDDDRARRGRRVGRLPAPRDRAGHLHQLQERPAVQPQEAAVRHRADRQVLSQRDHARQLHLPHARVRADGDGVLRAARPRRQQWFEHWLEQRLDWYTDLGIRPDHLQLRAHDADELSHYSSGTSDVEYLFPIGWSRARGHRQPRRLRPHPARRALRREARVLRPGDAASATCRT